MWWNPVMRRLCASAQSLTPAAEPSVARINPTARDITSNRPLLDRKPFAAETMRACFATLIPSRLHSRVSIAPPRW